jgi:hypothetical protein
MEMKAKGFVLQPDERTGRVANEEYVQGRGAGEGR